ncbi:S8 family serine peptidase [Amycolatopsis cihanbeyliensis]|uniref:Peptidase inhibitor I9 n=1 Tax=Amycolatopsis cihanbeyliensis TaxID=1128664 RepID=A0A542DHP9_AMYCI|nr:S8 family serine peptidase [Amycolatopsis cihanbeyliensis]TQJ02617.1 peptidase inhibitor I9 [Amycolatopsis cihanbeyliensis]
MRRWVGRGRVLAAGIVLSVLAGVLALSGGPARAAEGQVHTPAGAQAIAGSYIVLLKPGGRPVAEVAGALAEQHGGEVDRTYGAALRGFTLSASERQARRLAADPRVDRVEADSVVSTEGTQTTPPWNLDRVDQHSTVLNDTFRYPDGAGAGVTVYVMDTGVRTSHEEFQSRARVGFDAIGDGWNGQDCSTSGHGTHVAGLVGGATYGVAKQARLVSVRVLSCENVGSVSQIIAGVDWVTEHAERPAVVNMSLGGSESAAEELAIKNSIDSGITYVVAAGNEDRDACRFSPAGLAEAITVGASNPLDERARDWEEPGSSLVTGSNYGECLDMFAPGESIKSAHNALDTATVIQRGTSMASPHVAGAAALVLSESPNLTPEQVADTLLGRATTGVLRQDTLETGSPNKLLYTGVPPPAVCTVGNDTRRPVPDLGSVTSSIEVTTCPRKVAPTARVRVRAEHPVRGDLSLRLVTPDGSERVLKEADGTDTAADVHETYPLPDLSTMDANGTWKLVVRDHFGFDQGALVDWKLVLAEPAVGLPVVSSTDYPANGQPHGGAGVAGEFTFRPGSPVPVAKYSYQLDGEAQPTEVTATDGVATVTLTPEGAGRRSLTVRAFNGVGEPSARVVYDFVVADQPPPASPVVSSFDYPADEHPNGGAGVPGTFTFKPGDEGPIDGYSYQLDTGTEPTEVSATGEVTVGIAPDAAGTRTLTVRAVRGGVPSAPTTFSFVVAGAAETVDGGMLAVDGQEVNADIPADRVLRLRFDGTAGDRLGLGLAESTLDTFAKVWVLDPDGNPVSTKENNAPSYFSSNSSGGVALPELTTTGTYQVLVDPDGAGTGAVTVLLSSNATGTTDTTEQGHPFELTRSGQYAEIGIDAEADTWYNLGFTEPSDRFRYLWIEVRGPDGTVDGPWAIQPSQAVRFHAGEPGRYRVVVGYYFAESPGSGKLWLSEEIDAGEITTSGQGTALSLHRPGQHARMRFDGTQGQRLNLGYTDIDLSTPGGTVPPKASVIGPDGTTKTPDRRGDSARIPVLTRTGSHDLVVTGGAGTGTVTVWLSEDVPGGTIAIGGDTTVTTTRPGQHATVRFDGTAGQRLNIGLTDMTSGFDNQSVRLYAPDGTKVGYGGNLTGADSFGFDPLPVTGTYELAVGPTNGQFGTVRLTLSAPADAGSITISGAQATMPIDLPGQDGHVSFAGAAGDRLRLTFGDRTFSGPYYLTVLNPDGTKLVDRAYRTDDSPYDLPELPASGEYLVIIDPQSAATGSIAVGVERQ